MTAHQFGVAGPLYPFTTENLAGYLGRINFSGKSVLTVHGSGDHALNAFFLGAKSVASFDVNARTSYFSELKFAALKTLDRREFLDFISPRRNAKTSWHHATYARLKKRVSEDARAFFDGWYARYQNSGDLLRLSPLFSKRQYDLPTTLRCNPYLASDFAFRRTAARLRENAFSWHHCALKAILRHFAASKFDIILLSNLADYLPEMFPEEKVPLAAFERFLTKLRMLLNPRGTIVAAYLYDTRASLRHSIIDDPGTRLEIFGKMAYDYEEFEFPGINRNREDAVVILTSRPESSVLSGEAL